jgi:hypothetical protein
VFIGISVISCSPKYSTGKSSRATIAATPGVADYGNLYYWAAHPDKQDPSDSLPLPLRDKVIKDDRADVFFIYPTSFTSRSDTGWNASLTDEVINNKTDYSSILYQASAFNEYRIFSPRYRQAHIRSYYTKDEKAKAAFDLAYADVKAAFEFYLKQYNNQRPIIIASHSQGSTHAQRLLKEFFDGQPLKEQLVAAYMPGMYIPPNYYSNLKMCQDSTSTGCFVGWRTFKRGYLPDFVQEENGSCLVTNPLTWTTTKDYAPYKLNSGAVTTQFNRVRKGVTDAQIHEGVLWINRPHIPGSIFLKMKNFHIGDINLFYMNIRKNLRTRANTYFQNLAGNLSSVR